MRSILLVAVALSVAFHGSEAGASQKGRERRSVEVIVMGTEPAPRGSAVDATAPRAEDNGGNRQVTASNSLPPPGQYTTAIASASSASSSPSA